MASPQHMTAGHDGGFTFAAHSSPSPTALQQMPLPPSPNAQAPAPQQADAGGLNWLGPDAQQAPAQAVYAPAAVPAAQQAVYPQQAAPAMPTVQYVAAPQQQQQQAPVYYQPAQQQIQQQQATAQYAAAPVQGAVPAQATLQPQFAAPVYQGQAVAMQPAPQAVAPAYQAPVHQVPPTAMQQFAQTQQAHVVTFATPAPALQQQPQQQPYPAGMQPMAPAAQLQPAQGAAAQQLAGGQPTGAAPLGSGPLPAPTQPNFALTPRGKPPPIITEGHPTPPRPDDKPPTAGAAAAKAQPAQLVIRVESAEPLVPDRQLVTPLVRLHVVDPANGHYLRVPVAPQPAAAPQLGPDGQPLPPPAAVPAAMAPLGAVQTRPYNLAHSLQQQYAPRWGEELSLALTLEAALAGDALLLFELLQPLAPAESPLQRLRLTARPPPGAMQVAWGYLRLKGDRGVVHTGPKRLRLYRYPPGT